MIQQPAAVINARAPFREQIYTEWNYTQHAGALSITFSDNI